MFFVKGEILQKLPRLNVLVFTKFKDSCYYCFFHCFMFFFRAQARCKLFSLFLLSLVGGKSGMGLNVREIAWLPTVQLNTVRVLKLLNSKCIKYF